MITKEERQSIVNEAVERALLLLPEVIGNLIVNQTAFVKMNREFYSKYPEFSKSKDVVQAVVEKIEGDNFGLDYREVLEKSVPIIKERLKLIDSLDFKTVNRPSRDLSKLNLMSNNGEL